MAVPPRRTRTHGAGARARLGGGAPPRRTFGGHAAFDRARLSSHYSRRRVGARRRACIDVQRPFEPAMNLLSVLSAVGTVQQVRASAQGWSRRLALVALYGGVALVFVIVAVAFLAAALFIWLTDRMAPVGA